MAAVDIASVEIANLKENTPIVVAAAPAKPAFMGALANPAPVGLFGFGLTTVLLNIHNAGFFTLDILILSMGLAYGGSAQLFAGLLEFAKGNTFGFTAFVSYGAFWLSFVALKLLPKMSIFSDVIPAADVVYMGWYLFMWGCFTAIMFVGTLKAGPALQFIFGSLTVLFMLLAIADWSENKTITKIAGWEGIICGLSAIYTGAAQIWHDAFGKKVLPY